MSTLQCFAALIFLLYLSVVYLTFVLSRAILNALLERDGVYSKTDQPITKRHRDVPPYLAKSYRMR